MSGAGLDGAASVRREAARGAPVLAVDGFEGPIDWLLELARARRIDLARLPIAALIQGFAEALDAALARPDRHAVPLQRWGDWLVMAATLTQLRSRLLVPAEAGEAGTALGEAEALRQRLLGRAQMRAAADWIERRPLLGREAFACGRPERGATRPVGDVTDLLRACLLLLRVPEHLAAAFRPPSPPAWRVPQAIARIRARLRGPGRGGTLASFLPAIDAWQPDRPARCRVAVASTLLACLELAREDALVARQDGAWEAIVLTPVEARRTRDG